MYVQVCCILLFRMTEKRCMVYLLQCRPVLTLKKYVAECSVSCGTEGEEEMSVVCHSRGLVGMQR